MKSFYKMLNNLAMRIYVSQKFVPNLSLPKLTPSTLSTRERGGFEEEYL